jgi:hypothetical protein
VRCALNDRFWLMTQVAFLIAACGLATGSLRRLAARTLLYLLFDALVWVLVPRTVLGLSLGQGLVEVGD